MSDTTDLASTIRLLALDIRDLYRELPDTVASIAGLHAVTYAPTSARSATDVRVLGGDAAVMLGGGTDNVVTSSRRGNRDHAADNHPTDPPSVLAVLTRIEDAWRQAQQQPAAETTTTTAATDYLIANAEWAATHHEPIHDDIADLAQLRARLRNVTGHTDTPKASDAPCIDCNGRIVQRYRHGRTPETSGLDDTRECNRCGKTYTPTQYANAIEQRLETIREDPDRLVTAAEARTLWRLSEKQLYTWENREKIRPAGTDDRGRRLYRNGDIHALKTRTAA